MTEASARTHPSDDAHGVGRVPAGASASWFRQRPWVVDLVVVLAVFTYNLPIQVSFVPGGLWPGTGAVVSLGLCAPYLARRRHPLRVFCAVLLAAVVQVLLGVGLLVADVMLLFALYNLATRLRWTVTVPAAASVVGWLLVASGPSMRQGYTGIGDLGVLVVVVIWAWTWGTLVKTRQAYIESLREHARRLAREREAQGKVAAARERARIAREIHDIVSHSLSVVVVMADGAAAKAHSEPERARQAMLAVRDTGRTALAEMRRMLGVLRDGEPGSHAPQPGIAHLDRLIADSQAVGLPVELAVRGRPAEVSAGLDLAVYRVVQEALTNVRKHAGPRLGRAEVALDYGDTTLQVRITDDGRGGQEGHGGHGLVGMRERVAAYGGTLRAGRRPGGGFEVVAEFPIGGDCDDPYPAGG
ncbi:sensor histidine kinase [Nonomuraea candida]|uniref:sensor histidine kinase n=1 Tax=Nonomuraea candida TaxID=359159 RepID=UPI0007C87C83|nr:sensor histidine kinase [Nonomuraea candida]